MRDVLHAEWTKLRTRPGFLALALAVVAGTVAVGALSADCTGQACGPDLPRLALTGVQLGQALVAILAVLVMGDEYGTRMITVTLAAVPRRVGVLAAKALLVAAGAVVVASVAVGGSVVTGHLLLPAHHTPVAQAVRAVVYLTLVALLALGTATAVREPAAAMGIVLTLLYALPIVISVVTDHHTQQRLERWEPATAGLSALSTVGGQPIGPWHGLGVLALWTLAALAVGGLLLHHRDA